MTRVLEDLLLGYEEGGDLKSRLLWIEAVSIAAADPELELGPDGARAALDLRATLGAIIAFAHSAQTDRDLLTMELTVRALLARALSTLYGALSDSYRELAAEGAPYETECRSLSRIFKDVQRATKRGDPIPPNTLRKVETLRKDFNRASR